MDALFSAILGELASRSMSLLIDRYSSKSPPPPSDEEKIQRLEKVLLRLAVVIEDAEGRRITNHAMLRQLNMIRQDMHRGCYLIDTFRFHGAHEEMYADDDDDEVSYKTFVYIQLCQACPSPYDSRRHGDKGDLEQVLDNLEIAMDDMVEFVLLLNNYPSMHRQPYNTYLFMEKCMFGRQMEVEHVINFLLLPEPPNIPSVNNHGVLPIIGPTKVGKSTLVEHVCYDERVRNHFSRIIFLTDSDFREERSLITLRDSRAIRHKYISSSTSSEGERLLVVVELAEDVGDDEWTRLLSSSQSCITAGSKIIITSQSEKIAKLGTTQPLHLKFLSREAYWYFFKVLAFGSSDPKEHPNVASSSMAMFNLYFDHELYRNFDGPFIDLNILASLIQATVYEDNWLNLHERIRGYFLLTRGSGDSGLKSKPVPIPKTNATMQYYYCMIYDHCQVGLVLGENQAPKIDMIWESCASWEI